MKQGDGADLLGPNDPRSASIGVIYVTPNDDRQTVLTAILTQDKLGRKQVVVVLPEQNRAFQRPIDFDGLKNMRRGLKAQIAFVAPGGPGPAEFARQRRFPVYSSPESFAQSLKAETIENGTTNGSAKRGLFGFGRKKESAAAVAVASTSGSRIEEEPTSPILANGSTGHNAAAIGMAGLAAGAGFATLAGDHSASSTLENSDADWRGQSLAVTGSQVNSGIPSSGIQVQQDEDAKPGGPSNMQNNVDPGPAIIAFSANTPRPKTTGKLPVPPVEAVAVPIIASSTTIQPNGPSATPPTRRGNTGKTAAVVAGVGVGAAMAGRADSGGGGLPPGGSTPGGPGGGGGGVGGSRKRTRILLAILLGVLTLLLIGGITVAAIPGGLSSITHVLPGASTRATVTITPDSQDLTNIYVITAVTGTPNPAMRQVSARILTATSPTQSQTVNSTGSIPGLRATGALIFLNNTTSSKTFSSVVLIGASGVPVSFNGPITVSAFPGYLTITGFAVNVGFAGNIGALDINNTKCCANGITVKNGTFRGGQNPQANTVVQQSDINGAAKTLTDSLTPGTQAALQKQIKPGEQVVTNPNTLICNKSTFTANHRAGDIAPNVTVTVAITCKEEVYDAQAATTMAAGLLKTNPPPNAPAPPYALAPNTSTAVTKAMLVDTKGTVSLNVSATGAWVYTFSASVQDGFKTNIAGMSQQAAKDYLKGKPGKPGQPGVSDVQINYSNDTLPAASQIDIVIKPILGPIGTPTAGTPVVTPTKAITPTATPQITPTPTTGLGGS